MPCSTLGDNCHVRPRFSVVLVVRNRADVIGRAVAGVLAQTFGRFELVVVDDGSTDDTVAVARSVADRRVRIVRQEHAGTAAARTTGVLQARGELVAVLDVDDEVNPGWLARFGQLLDASGASFVGCGGEQVHRDGSRTRITNARGRTGAYVVDRELLVDIGAFGGPLRPPRPAEVLERLVTRIELQGLVAVHTPESLVQWNETPEPERLETMHAEDHAAPQARLRAAQQAIDALARSPIPDEHQLARYATIGGIAAVQAGEPAAARRLFGLARSSRPEVARHWARWLVSCCSPVATRVWCSEPTPTEQRSEVCRDSAAPDSTAPDSTQLNSTAERDETASEPPTAESVRRLDVAHR